MSLDVLLQAIHLTLQDLLVGAAFALAIGALLWPLVAVQKHAPQRIRPEREDPIDLAGEFEVYRQRKDAEYLAGPDGRHRLPSGRRAA